MRGRSRSRSKSVPFPSETAWNKLRPGCKPRRSIVLCKQIWGICWPNAPWLSCPYLLRLWWGPWTRKEGCFLGSMRSGTIWSSIWYYCWKCLGLPPHSTLQRLRNFHKIPRLRWTRRTTGKMMQQNSPWNQSSEWDDDQSSRILGHARICREISYWIRLSTCDVVLSDPQSFTEGLSAPRLPASKPEWKLWSHWGHPSRQYL